MKIPLIDIRPDHLQIVRDILHKHVPQYEVWAFGSRAKWMAKQYSDLDLAVITDNPLSLSVSASLSDDFSESDLPWKVDVVDWATTSESFRKIIERDKVVVQKMAEKSGLGMAGEWVDTILADVSSDVSYGYTESASAEKVGPRFLRITDIQNGIVDWDSVPYCPITEANHQKYRLQPGDIVVARTGNSTGENFLYRGNEDAVYASYLIRFRIDCQKADPAFVWYNLRSDNWRSFINNSKTGSAQAGANAKILGIFPIVLPPLPEQRAIAHILGAMDDKIELNRRMNETLEAMARTLFKSWFVDFDPVRAKAEGRDPGLPKPLADLFPDSFEESELGEIPKGWQCSTVGNHFKLTMGQSPPGSTYNQSGDGLPFFQGRTDFGFRFPSRRVFCTAPARLAEAGDTLVSVRAPVGDVNIAIEQCAVGRGVAAVRHFSCSRSFTYHAMHNLGKHFRNFEGEGTVFGSINKADFERLPFVAPPQDVLDRFELIASPIDDRVESNEKESRTLAALRDALLPKLISGEIRVKAGWASRTG